MQLSQRLLAVADLASAGHCLADVGTDHGYIPIYLMEKGNYERAIAMDVRKGPLLRAEENRKSHGFEDRMDLRLSDGVAALREGEADTVVIAGMGGGLGDHYPDGGSEGTEERGDAGAPAPVGVCQSPGLPGEKRIPDRRGAYAL